MAKRRKDLSDKLGETKPRGWQDQIGSKPETQPTKDTARTGRLVRKTLLLTDDLIERLDELADTYNVGKNELARYLLELAIEQVESGAHELPTEPVRQNTLGV